MDPLTEERHALVKKLKKTWSWYSLYSNKVYKLRGLKKNQRPELSFLLKINLYTHIYPLHINT